MATVLRGSERLLFLLRLECFEPISLHGSEDINAKVKKAFLYV